MLLPPPPHLETTRRSCPPPHAVKYPHAHLHSDDFCGGGHAKQLGKRSSRVRGETMRSKRSRVGSNVLTMSKSRYAKPDRCRGSVD